MAMKGKAELTITICVGSSIVSCTVLPLHGLRSQQGHAANRDFCYPVAGHRWVDVSGLPTTRVDLLTVLSFSLCR